MVIEFNEFYKCLDPKVFRLVPEEQWTEEQFLDLACEETLELDTIGEERILALKHLFFRLMVPKEHWGNCPEEKFISIVKSKYQERLNEEN